MYKYLLLACLLLVAVSVMVEAQGGQGMGAAMQTGQASGQSNAQGAVVGSASTIPVRAAGMPVGMQQMVNRYRQLQRPRNPFFGLSLNDILLMHYLDFGLF